MTPEPSPTALPAALSAVAATASAVTALIAYRLNRRKTQVDGLSTAVSRLEETRAVRGRVLYELDRDRAAKWTKKQREDVHQLIAEIDFIALLVLARQVSLSTIFAIYGDTLLRCIYQLAPYVNSARDTVGEQFALPISRLAPRLLLHWARESRLHRYPQTIGFSREQPRRLILQTFLSEDGQVQKFIYSDASRAVAARLWLYNIMLSRVGHSPNNRRAGRPRL